MTGPTTRLPQSRRRRIVPEGAGLSHAGRVRTANEDAILVDPSGILWAVADGMGGHGHGDVAADIVIDHLTRVPVQDPGRGDVVEAIEAANTAIRRWAAGSGVAQMGATVVAALVNDAGASLLWVGDSRAYRWRRGTLLQVTRDHSVVQELVEAGRLSRAEAERHPQANVVTRAVGAADRVDVDAVDIPLEPGDILLLCSDGLTKVVADADVAAAIHADASADQICRRLVEAALHGGAPDNVSVIAIRTDGRRDP